MEPGADERAVQQVAVLLALAPAVDEFVYVDQEATYAEFVEYYVSEEPELLDIVDPERLPTSFRVQSQAPDSLIGILSNQDGVAEVDVPTPDG
ncbi:MAG: permease-like cell division protein FtsX [Actinomycetota bacterium]